MKLLKELELEFESPLWSFNPELAVIDTILDKHPAIYEIVSNEIIGPEKIKIPAASRGVFLNGSLRIPFK